MTDSLPLADVERLLRLLDEALNPNENLSVPDRRRLLMKGLCKLVDADVWMWSTTVANPDKPGDMSAVFFLDDGWKSTEQQSRAYEMLVSPDFGQRFLKSIHEAMALGKAQTFIGRDLIPQSEYEEFTRQWSASGLDACLFSIYPLGPGRSSNAGIHRRIGKPPYTEREKLIVQTVYTQIESLHHYGDNEAAQEPAIRLSPRERLILHLVLAGHSHKVIADRIGISPHTVNDYVKSLHRVFEVGSRAELQAKFFIGSPNDDGLSSAAGP